MLKLLALRFRLDDDVSKSPLFFFLIFFFTKYSVWTSDTLRVFEANYVGSNLVWFILMISLEETKDETGPGSP